MLDLLLNQDCGRRPMEMHLLLTDQWHYALADRGDRRFQLRRTLPKGVGEVRC